MPSHSQKQECCTVLKSTRLSKLWIADRLIKLSPEVHKGLLKYFLQASNVRYSSLALSDVSPTGLPHYSITDWFEDKNFLPKQLDPHRHAWSIKMKRAYSLWWLGFVTTHSKEKIDLVNYQYSANAQNTIAVIDHINLISHSWEQGASIAIGYRNYEKSSDGKTNNTHFSTCSHSRKTRHPSISHSGQHLVFKLK